MVNKQVKEKKSPYYPATYLEKEGRHLSRTQPCWGEQACSQTGPCCVCLTWKQTPRGRWQRSLAQDGGSDMEAWGKAVTANTIIIILPSSSAWTPCCVDLAAFIETNLHIRCCVQFRAVKLSVTSVYKKNSIKKHTVLLILYHINTMLYKMW